MPQTSSLIKELAKTVGFDLCGITKAELVPEAVEHYKNWIKNGFHGEMKYLEDTARRTNPLEVMSTAKSIIMLAVNYYSYNLPEGQTKKIARYARGRDYHKYIEKMLKEFCKKLSEHFPNETFRYYVDYGPLMERTYAEKAGLGFIGKNGNIITEEFGSWVLLAEVLTSLNTVYDTPKERKCGTCTRCLTSCPTDAFVAERMLDAKKCISYQTIENKTDTIPTNVRENMKEWSFGCDICQEVCPFNNRLRNKDTTHGPLEPRYTTLEEMNQYLESDELFLEKFQGTPLMRTKRSGIKRNIRNETN